jgi:hypothetical protein
MVDVAYVNVVDRLLEVLPEIRCDYEVEAATWGAEGPHAHVVFGSVFAKFVDQLVTTLSERDDEELVKVLDRAFDLIEELTLSSDFETRCVVEASVLESFLGDADGWRRFSKHFRRNTMQMGRKVMERFSGNT